MELERPLLKVPSATLGNIFRSYTRSVEKEVNNVVSVVSQLAARETVSKEEARKAVGALVGRLKGLKRKVLHLTLGKHGPPFLPFINSFFFFFWGGGCSWRSANVERSGKSCSAEYGLTI